MSQENRLLSVGLFIIFIICNVHLQRYKTFVEATSLATDAPPSNISESTSAAHNVSTANSVTTEVPVTVQSSVQVGPETAIDSTTSEPTHPPSTTAMHEILGSDGPDKREQEAILKALDWLKMKRAADYGWGNDTHVVILAKELSGARDPSDADGHLQVIQELEDMLSIKEMEIEILAMLDRHHTLPKPLNLEKLARYVLALGSLCKDPKHFHGHDLVATLQHHEPTQDIEFALTTLSACSSAAHVRKRQIRRLLDIASGVTDQSVDTIAMVSNRSSWINSFFFGTLPPRFI